MGSNMSQTRPSDWVTAAQCTFLTFSEISFSPCLKALNIRMRGLFLLPWSCPSPNSWWCLFLVCLILSPHGTATISHSWIHVFLSPDSWALWERGLSYLFTVAKKYLSNEQIQETRAAAIRYLKCLLILSRKSPGAHHLLMSPSPILVKMLS